MIKYNKITSVEVVKMADTLKNRVRFSTTLFPETKERLDKFAIASGIPISKITEKAILEYLDKIDRAKKKGKK